MEYKLTPPQLAIKNRRERNIDTKERLKSSCGAIGKKSNNYRLVYDRYIGYFFETILQNAQVTKSWNGVDTNDIIAQTDEVLESAETELISLQMKHCSNCPFNAICITTADTREINTRKSVLIRPIIKVRFQDI